MKVLLLTVLYLLVGCSQEITPVIMEYDMSELPSDFGGDEAYTIGLNDKGMLVFVDPDRAFEQFVSDYKDGIRAVQREFYLLPISRLTWESYGIYGWQLTHEDQAIVEQGYEISRFFDIYENSFNPNKNKK